MAVVELDYAAWVVQFPAFNTLPEPTVQSYWDLAGIYFSNGPCCGVANPPRGALLNLLTAHLAQLFSGANGSGPSGLVGRVNSATEGSVSVSTADMGQQSASASWYQQTPYGAAYWLAIGPYRSARYIAGPVRVTEPFRFAARFGPGGFTGRWGL